MESLAPRCPTRRLPPAPFGRVGVASRDQSPYPVSASFVLTRRCWLNCSLADGRCFIGNTPTVVARAGQKIRWYVFNLDLSMNWHNFHPHAQRWKFANETIDVRGISPAESFVVETTAPPVLMLPEALEAAQHPDHRRNHAHPYHLRGDFLVHCHVEMHMMMGLAALVRSQQTVWLTPDEAHALSATVGLPLDPGDNSCPAFLFDPTTNAFTAAGPLHTGRFYPTTVTLADGKPLTLFGEDHANAPGVGVQSLEIFTPGGAGSWSAAKAVPFNYFYYPWTFLLPGGDLFIAGPQKPARRFNPASMPIVDDPARQYNQISSQRGVNMDGTAVLLPLRPPHYPARVMILGGSAADAQQTAEWIDLSAVHPVWEALPNLNVPRDKVNSVLLPDGRVLIAGGIETLPDGGPAELFDPDDPASGFQIGPNMKYIRGYHSAALLLPDGSVIMGGDPNGGTTPNERYRPSYFFKPRPAITASPAAIAYGAAFSVQTPVPGSIAEVVLMRAGAVTHGFNQNQRYVGCVMTGHSATQVNVTAPPDGTIAPPGWYLLFLVDTDRIPSPGVWIRLS